MHSLVKEVFHGPALDLARNALGTHGNGRNGHAPASAGAKGASGN